jgi:transcription elongation GreA/GreB family factor
MAKTADIKPVLDSHVQLINAGRIDTLEEQWIEQVATLPTTPDFFKPWLQAMRKVDALARAEGMIALLAEDRLERKRPKDALRVLLAALPSFESSEALRPLLIRGLRGQYAELDQLDTLLRICGFEDGGSLVKAYRQFREWVRLTPGQVYQHYDWGEGVVHELDLAAGKVTLAFPAEPRKQMTVEGVRKFLAWIEPKHFLARRAKDPESLQTMSDDSPLDLIKLVLTGQPEKRLKQSELKAMLTGVVIPDTHWNSWWAAAREELAVDPFIDFDRTGGARAVIGLRDKPRTFAEEIEEGFFDPEIDVAGRVELIRRLARRPKDAELPKALVDRMSRRLREEWALVVDSSPVIRLEIAYMLQDLAQAVPDAGIVPPNPQPILDGVTDFHELFAVDHHDYGARALISLIHRDGEAGILQAAGLLPQAPVKFAQAIWEAMEEEHHTDQGVQALQRLFDNPVDNPETFVWALRATLDGSWGHLEDYFPAEAMIPELIEQMDQWQGIAEDGSETRERREAAKKLLSRGRALLSAEHFELLSLAIEGVSREMAARIRRQIQTHSAFNAGFKSQADRAITVTRRDLLEPEESAAAENDGVFHCTAKAKNKATAELREIKSVLIPRNAKVIEEARMEGDLRENAGYQYAKEEQKMLVQKQATLSDLLSRANVIGPDEVPQDRIGFGARFTVRNLDSGQDETYTLMGRWEADPDRNILSDQAPLARQFTGRGAGDKLLVQRPGAPATNYEVLMIENALADAEWQPAQT